MPRLEGWQAARSRTAGVTEFERDSAWGTPQRSQGGVHSKRAARPAAAPPRGAATAHPG